MIPTSAENRREHTRVSYRNIYIYHILHHADQ